LVTLAKFAGLHTAHNYVSSVPEGALSVADNCVISSEDTVEPRRGQYALDYTFGTAVDRPNVIWNYGTSVLAHYGDATITRDTGSAFTDYSGTFTPVDDALCRMRGVAAAQNFYVNTATGVKVLDSVGGSFSAAGVPQCLDIWETGATTSSAGFLLNDRAIAYRALIGQRDANSRWHYGAPSQRTIITNSPISIPIGGIVKVATVATVTLSATDQSLKYLVVGNTVNLATSETAIAAGIKTITAIDTTTNTFTFSEGGSDKVSTIVHSFQIVARSSKIAVGIPTGLSTSDVVQVYRTETAAAASIDPGDETYQIYETNIPADVTVAAGGVVSNNGTGAVVVTSVAHPYVVGQSLFQSPAENSLSAGSYIITATTADTFTFKPSGTVSTFTSLFTHTFSPRSIVVEDTTPEALLGDPLYTNPNTGDGLEASRYEPPVSKDMCRFGNRMWWLNSKWKHTFNLELLGVGSPDGVQNNDTISLKVDSTTYTYTATTAVNGTAPNARKFAIHTHNNSPSLNIELTALELVRCINQDVPAAPFYAVYASNPSDPHPGRIDILEKTAGGSAIQVAASRFGSWNPILPTVASSATASANDTNEAAVRWSDLDDPESFPLGNELTVGDRNDPIYRGAPLRDSLFVFKKQGGVSVIPNQLPFRARELDPTCRLLSPDTVVSLNNKLYALTEQGLSAISEVGVDIIGWPLDYDVRALLNTAQDAITRIPFAVSYESERQLWLWLPESGSDTFCTQAYIFNHATRAFTRAPVSRTCGLVVPGTNIMWLGDGESNTLIRERKSFDDTDYTDDTLTSTLVSVSGTILTLSEALDVEAGDLITDALGQSAYIEDVDGFTVTTSNQQDWTPGSTVTIHRAFTCEVTSVPLTGGSPGTSKAIGGAVYTFRDLRFRYGKATIATDEAPAAEYQFDSGHGYGSGGYGVLPYGNPSDNLNKYVTLGTNGALITLGFKIRQARAKWRLLAMTAQVDGQSERGP
jgi:hypothetical protein